MRWTAPSPQPQDVSSYEAKNASTAISAQQKSKNCAIEISVSSLLFFFSLWLYIFGTGATAEQQCANANTTLPPPRSYVRDGPLHEKLVADTWKALSKFDAHDASGKYRPRYFEGWYYKLDLPGEGGTFVVIPGLYLRKEDPHGFVMILDATHGADPPVCRLYKFPVEGVVGAADGDHDFVFRLDDRNVFTAHGFVLDLPADDVNPAVVGSAEWVAPLPLLATRWNPTIMGWFSWLPRGTMQCSHGVVSTDHAVAGGAVTIGNAHVVRLAGARGYVEKDWGREFPESYAWIQANDFSRGDDEAAAVPGASFMVSVASIPVRPFERWWQFTGFLSFLRYPDEEGVFHTMRFATYTGAKISYAYNITQHPNSNMPREHTVSIEMTSLRHRLSATVTGHRDSAATLWGPLPSNPSGGMHTYVREMLNCPVHVVLTRRTDGMILFEGNARHGGFEIEGHDEKEAVA